MKKRVAAATGIAVVLLSSVYARGVRAQRDCGTVEAPQPKDVTFDPGLETLAKLYAPILHFGPLERRFPTLPYFTAFDGEYNSAEDPSAVDFASPSEVAETYLVEDDTVAAWFPIEIGYERAIFTKLIFLNADVERLGDELKGARKEYGDTSKAFRDDSTKLARLEQIAARGLVPPPLPAATYRVLDLPGCSAQAATLRHLLLSDPQARRRIPDFLRTLDLMEDRSWLAFEYYFYYTSDNGLTGHPNDLEKFYVLAPRDTSVHFRVLVGNGHSVTTPNNVLVISGDLAQLTEQSHNHAIVEVGGHSMAPDIVPWSQFTVGWDINWHAYDRVWGVRDVQAMTGVGFNGDYEPGLTLPRNRVLTLTPDSAWADIQTGDGISATYALIPQERLRRIRLLAGNYRGPADSQVVRGINSELAAIENGLRPVRDTFVELRLPEDSAGITEVLSAVRSWDRMLLSDPDAIEPESKVKQATATMPWLDEFYQQNPYRILKGWMYRPGTSTECTKFDEVTSFTQFPPLAVLESVGEVPALLSGIPVYSEDVGLEFRVGYTGQFHCIEERRALHFPGVAQLQLGFKDRMSPSSVVLTYDPHYFIPQSFSWFVSSGFYAANWDANSHLTFQTGAGLSFMPLGMFLAEGGESRSGLFLRSIRFRFGVRFNPFHLSDDLGRMTWETSLDFRIPWLFKHRYL